MSDSADESKAGPLATVLGGIASILSYFLFRYVGLQALVPLLGTFAFVWLGSTLLPESRRKVIPVLAVHGGHFLWFVVGLVIVGVDGIGVTLDLAIYVVGLAWLLKRASVGPVVLLALYQVVALGINGFDVVHVEVDSLAHKALVVHIVWRLLSLYFLFTLSRALRERD